MDKKKRIVIGSMPQDVSNLRSALEAEGYEVIVASNGRQVENSIGLDPSAYVIDTRLPTWWKSGVDAMSMIRRTYIVPVVYIVPSGCSCPVDIRRYEQKAAVFGVGDALNNNEIVEVLSAIADLIELHEHTISDYDWD